jgi:hypothetical protein
MSATCESSIPSLFSFWMNSLTLAYVMFPKVKLILVTDVFNMEHNPSCTSINSKRKLHSLQCCRQGIRWLPRELLKARTRYRKVSVRYEWKSPKLLHPHTHLLSPCNWVHLEELIVAQQVNKLNAVCYRTEGRGFESRWGHWIFSSLPNSSSRVMALGFLSL